MSLLCVLKDILAKPVLGEAQCVTVDGVAMYAQPSATGGWWAPTSDGLVQVEGEIVVDLCGAACKQICACPALDVGEAAFTAAPNDPVSFPHTACLVEDYAVPVSFGADADACLTDADPATPILVRWNFDHSIDPSTGHTGFSVGDAGGVGTVVATSNGSMSVMVGPAVTPHNGPRDDYWVDIEFTVADLLAGVVLQTSALGTSAGTQCETVHSQSIEISPDDVNLETLCSCNDGGCC